MHSQKLKNGEYRKYTSKDFNSESRVAKEIWKTKDCKEKQVNVFVKLVSSKHLVNNVMKIGNKEDDWLAGNEVNMNKNIRIKVASREFDVKDTGFIFHLACIVP